MTFEASSHGQFAHFVQHANARRSSRVLTMLLGYVMACGSRPRCITDEQIDIFDSSPLEHTSQASLTIAVAGGRRPIHGRACSSWLATRMMVASWAGPATS